MPEARAPELDDVDAFVLDMDGVVTETAGLHFAAWKRTFDDLLAEHGGADARPFTRRDYLEHVDGRPRSDGVTAFLASRGLELPRGSPDDPPDAATVAGVGNRKNQRFLSELRRRGADRYGSTVRFVGTLRARGVPVAVISSSRNAHEVLARTGTDGLFDAAVTGIESGELGLDGKPAPDIFLEAARRLGVEPSRTAVVEDAVAGVEAAVRGGFRLVIGVDREGSGLLAAAGADVVVGDLAELADAP